MGKLLRFDLWGRRVFSLILCFCLLLCLVPLPKVGAASNYTWQKYNVVNNSTYKYTWTRYTMNVEYPLTAYAYRFSAVNTYSGYNPVSGLTGASGTMYGDDNTSWSGNYGEILDYHFAGTTSGFFSLDGLFAKL